MATRRQREKREKVSAKRWSDNAKSGWDNTAFTLPEGVELMRIDRDCRKKLNMLCYRVGKGNPNADEGEIHFERTYFVHYLGPDNRRYVCPYKTAGKPCPVCDERAKLARDPDADDKLVRSLFPRQRQLWLVEDLDEEEKGPQLLDYSYHQFGRRLKEEVDNSDEEDEFWYFADPQDGHTLRVSFTKAEGGYGFEAASIQFRKRNKSYDRKFVDGLPCLDDLLKVLPYDKLKTIFLQEGEDEEDEPEKKPFKPATSKAKAAKEDKPAEPESEDDDWPDGGDEPVAAEEKADGEGGDDDWDDWD